MKSNSRRGGAAYVARSGRIGKGGSNGTGRRVMMMLRHYTGLVTIGGLFLLIGLIGAATYLAARPTTLTIAVGPAGGEDAKLVQAMEQQLARDKAKIRLRTVLKDGPVESANAIDLGQADLAIVRRDQAMPKAGLAVAVLRHNVIALIVPAPGSLAIAGDNTAPKRKKLKAIEKIEDFPGHRIGLINSRNADLLNLILRQYNIPLEKVTVVPLDRDDIATTLKSNPVDVIFAAGPTSARFISDALVASTHGKNSATIIPIGSSEAIAEKFPVYESTEIKAGALGGSPARPEEDVETIGYSFFIMARRSLSDETTIEFTRLLFGLRASLAKDFPAAAKIEKPDTDRDADVQAHPGAAAYLDNDQKTFFEKYDDLIYITLMIASCVGTAGAWVASYFKTDQRTRRLRTLERLMELAKAARQANSAVELDDLRAQVDDILAHALKRADDGELDEQGISAFALALNQAQLAIAERRAALDKEPAPRQQQPVRAVS
jgi:TRAP transporter TAXI family solute receptor